MNKLAQVFRHFAESTARFTGKPVAFLGAALVIVVWAATGPLFKFGDTWQLVINTCTTIVTFLMVFLIQNSQNRDSAAVQIKLDELIRATHAYNGLLDLDEMDEEGMEDMRQKYRKFAHRHDQPSEPAAQGQEAAGTESRARADEGEDEEDVREIKGEIDRSKDRAVGEPKRSVDPKPPSD